MLEENKQSREDVRKVQRETQQRQQADEQQVSETKLLNSRLEVQLRERQ